MVTVKRYPNRKLYNTRTRQYITLEGIASLVREGEEILVTDNVTGEDLTALTLTQIILEQEKNQSGVLSHSILASLIRAGGEQLSALQRGMHIPFGQRRQVDEEIERRVLTLVDQGDLNASEGANLVEKLIQAGARQPEESIFPKDMENYIKQRQLPTKKDVKRLNEQLTELEARLEALSSNNSDSPPKA